MNPWPEFEAAEQEPLTPKRLFAYAGTVERANYRRRWVGNDYRMLCGKYRGSLLSQVADSKYLLWCLNFFENQLDSDLLRALKDQFNSQFS